MSTHTASDPNSTPSNSTRSNSTSPETSTSTPSNTSSPGLARPRPPRRRRWTRIAIALVIAAQAAALYVVGTRESTERVITQVEQHATTTVLTIPAPPVIVTMPAATSANDARACPPPRTDAPRIVPGEIAEDVQFLAVSPTNAGWIAAWNEEHVFVSTDAGRSFKRMLDGNGAVHDVAFDCFGHVVVARGGELGVAEGTREVWRTVPGIDLAMDDNVGYDEVSLIGGGRDVIVLGKKSSADDARARVAVSRDLGVTWAYHDLGGYYGSGETVAGVQRADGTILVGTTIPACMSEDLAWIEIAPDGTSKSHYHRIYGVHFQFWGDSIMSTYGTRKIDAPDETTWSGYPDESYYGIPIAAPYPVFVTEEKAARLVGTKLREYPWKLDGDQMQMDPAGRLWSLACGKPWIARSDRTSGYCVNEPPPT